MTTLKNIACKSLVAFCFSACATPVVLEIGENPKPGAGNLHKVMISKGDFCGEYCADMYLIDVYKNSCGGKEPSPAKIERTKDTETLDINCD